ncbi:DUF262 domain-containing protein [Candidatus Entotheonella palauensis]|uniref:GmrSD restriction endonucleases N-terminal domain-containing protein n=1 Tax=Candidatus Entotheonella gemina TaxID=1429439 RepID=W4LXZ5_9BACT|nr:DUF262 domain-containing protein [Candidatus Entotheonella palauensis]ETX02964.1 MAG: hypothetical protein ETSY2_34430 [Candidatus Entotheonella gemina]
MATHENDSLQELAGDSSVNDEEPVDDLDEATEIIPYTCSITSYGADYPVDALVKRIETKDIFVPAFNLDMPEATDIVGFQRQYVWPRLKADRFIESLLLGLPVPGIFLVSEPSGILMVLDGHQRLYTLHAYYQGVINGIEYALSKVQDRFNNKRYKDLDIEDQRRLDNSIVHATVIRQDEPTNDQSSIYTVFERLNTGGVNLQPQEIRIALYHGKFVSILQELNNDESWRKLYGKKSTRLKDIEMILRFFAFLYYSSHYHSPMKDFLNRYMATNRHLQKQSGNELRKIFNQTTQVILKGIGEKAFRPQRAINAAVIDSLLTGIAKRLINRGDIHNNDILKTNFNKLMNNANYRSAIETGTSQEANVRTRLSLAEQAFSEIP